MKEKVTIKSFFSTIWRGIAQTFEWFLGLLGLREAGRFAKTLKSIIAVCFTIWLVAGTISMIYSFFDDEVDMALARMHNVDEFRYSEETLLGSGIVFVDPWGTENNFIYNHNTGKATIKRVDWVVKSDDDSLAVFAKKGKRGYVSTVTGEVMIPAEYEKAWLFSEGLAAVQKDNRILFIDRDGNEVLKGNWRVDTFYNNPLFKGGYCVVIDHISGKAGLIDREGRWAIEPVYKYIVNRKNLWLLTDGETYTLLDSSFQPLISGDFENISLDDECIVAQPKGAPCRAYSYDGTLINNCVIYSSFPLMYTVGEENIASSDGCYSPDIKQMANALAYKVCYGDYDYRSGLMNRDGKIITEPLYSSITAIGADLYQCDPQGVIINAKGEIVK